MIQSNQFDTKQRTIINDTPIKSFFCRKNKSAAQSLKNERVRTDMYFLSINLL